MRRMLKDLFQQKQEPTTIFCDNNLAIMLSRNHVFHHKTKHIDTSYNFIREFVNNKDICLEFCTSKEQIIDIFAKDLARDGFQNLRSSMGVCEVAEE